MKLNALCMHKSVTGMENNKLELSLWLRTVLAFKVIIFLMLNKGTKLKSSFATKYCGDLQSCLWLCKQVLIRDKKTITDRQVTDTGMISPWNVSSSAFCNNKELIKGKLKPLINHSL